jgi:hypothetical protein
MTLQTGTKRHGWNRAVTGGVASSALALGLLMGVGSPAALAQPEPTPVTDAPPNEQAEAPATPTMTADQALAIIANEYDTGAGGGQLSNLIHDVLTLRAEGFMPSNANKMAIQEALEKRPNQTPLIEALKETLNYQLTLKTRQAAAGASQGGFTAGINQLPPGQQPDPTDPDNTGVFIGPSGGVTQPIG